MKKRAKRNMLRLILENPSFVFLLAFLGGALVGNIAKLIVGRAPTELPLLSSLWECPECGSYPPLRGRLPVLSYFLDRRRRSCGHVVPVQEPLIELVVAVSWVLTVGRLGLRPELPAFLTFVTTLVVLSAVDLEHRRIPNRILGPMTVVAAVLLSVAAIVGGRPEDLGRSAFGGLSYFAPMLLLGLLIPSSMGMGDIKLAGYLGLHLGWLSMKHVLAGAFLGFLIGALIGVGLMIAGKKGRKDYLPFGPSMALGAMAVILWGPL